MTGIPTGGGIGADLSIAPALANLGRDDALANEVHDAEEHEPRVVGIPGGHQKPEGNSEAPHS